MTTSVETSKIYSYSEQMSNGFSLPFLSFIISYVFSFPLYTSLGSRYCEHSSCAQTSEDKTQIYGRSRTFCLLTCDGYQNAEKQVGQLRLSSSSSSSSPKPDDDEKIEVEEEAEEVDKLLGTFPVLAIVFSICLPWAEFTFITALGFILASFFFWAIFILVFGVIFSETISMSSSSSKRFCDPLPGDCLGGLGFLTEVVTWMLYFSSFSCKQN